VSSTHLARIGCGILSGAGSMAARAKTKAKTKPTGAHRGLNLTCMHPLGLLPSITFYTILATHMLKDTFSKHWEQLLLLLK
jgi:hypothetical protein